MLKYIIFAPLVALLGSLAVSPGMAGTSPSTDSIAIAQYWDTCGQMGGMNVETFETEDFYVSICQEEDGLFLVGEAKDLSGFVDFPVLETRDRRYAVQEGEDYHAVSNDLLLTQYEMQTADDRDESF